MFGKYQSIEAFLDHYVKATLEEQAAHLETMPLESQAAFLSTVAFKDVVEVRATITRRLADDKAVPKHYQLNIVLDEITSYPPDVKADILECKSNQLPVFVAIRFGDRDGIAGGIPTGLDAGNKLHLKGQWITREKAYSHGGEKMSVLHFSHHPLGFTCTTEKCYS